MAYVTPEELQTWLEWAGRKLLSLPVGNPRPKGYVTARLDYVEDRQAYGYTAETMRAPAVGAEEVAIMDTILTWPVLASDPKVRRIIHMRMQVTPVSEKYVHSYKAIALELHIDARLAARLFKLGLAQLAKRVPKAQISMVRKFLSPS